jgi:hypothetical protein
VDSFSTLELPGDGSTGWVAFIRVLLQLPYSSLARRRELLIKIEDVEVLRHSRMYDRQLSPIPKPKEKGLRLKGESLVGITGAKMAKYRMSMFSSFMQPILVGIRPNMFLMSLYIA